MLSDEIFFQIHLAHGAPIVQQAVIAITGDKKHAKQPVSRPSEF